MNLLEYVQSLGSDISLEEKIALTKSWKKKNEPTQEVFQEENPNIKFNCIGFGLGYVLDELDEGMPFSIVYNIEENHWNGSTTLQLNMKDIKV